LTINAEQASRKLATTMIAKSSAIYRPSSIVHRPNQQPQATIVHKGSYARGHPAGQRGDSHS
jgi:hypothetical protein